MALSGNQKSAIGVGGVAKYRGIILPKFETTIIVDLGNIVRDIIDDSNNIIASLEARIATLEALHP